jgi:ferredoxin/nitrate reductase gamma subunit
MKMERVNENVLTQIKKLGAFDITLCYSCGTCSAVCPLSEGTVSFPRRMIRYSLLGLEKRIQAAPEPWLCYYCGECSQTCPRQAEPAALMMALRRWVTRKYSFGRIADAFYSAFASGLAWLILSSLAIAAIVLYRNPAMNRAKVDFLSFISLGHFHSAGLIIVTFIALAVAAQLFILYRSLRSGIYSAAFSVKNLKGSTWTTIKESVWQKRFADCQEGRLRRLAHMAVSWGFMGMFAATLIILAVDFQWLPLPRWVSFLVGSLSGAVTLAGLAYYLYLRFSRKTTYGQHSHHTDWVFLILLTLAVVSGFVMTVLRLINLPLTAYFAFAVHLVIVFNVMISFPFTKFAHVIYRPVALWLAGWK